MATKTRVSMRLEVGDRLAEPKGGYRVRMARGESESVEVSAELLDGGRPFDASGLSARFMAVLAGGRHVAMPVPPEGVSGGTLTYTLPSGLGATPGDTRLAVFELSDGDGYRIYTEPFTVSVTEGPSPTAAEIGPYVPELDALLAQLKAAVESATEAADEALAATAKAEAAIADVKATEAKLYPAAENVLVGGETGTVAHVEDAFGGATLRGITVEGACRQDGTPSPEEPKAITVVENPTVKVAGRNLLDISKLETNGSAPYGLNISIEDDSVIVKGTTSGVGEGNASPSFSLGWYADTSLGGRGLSIKLFGAPANVSAYGLRTAEETQIAVSTKLRDGDKVNWKLQISVSKDESGEYKPYTSQSLTFTLPAEHPYLAKLHDGTADTIEVDAEGNVELVARVAKVVLDGSQSFTTYQNGNIDTYYETAQPIGSGVVNVEQWGGMFDRFETANPYSNGSRVCAYAFANTNGTVFRIRPSETFADTSAFVNWLKGNPVTSYYCDTEPKTYQLGKIDMPKAQDSIVNVWTDAKVTPNTGIEYVRDVNIVVKNLESAIASIS